MVNVTAEVVRDVKHHYEHASCNSCVVCLQPNVSFFSSGSYIYALKIISVSFCEDYLGEQHM